jgi:hypothetical protein
VKSTALLNAPEPHLQPHARLYWRTSFTRGINRSAHSGHRMRSESTRYSFSGGIEYPHFGQRVLSDAFTLSRLIFCLLGIGAANYTWVRRSRLSTYALLHRRLVLANCSQNVGIAGASKDPAPVVRRAIWRLRAHRRAVQIKFTPVRVVCGNTLTQALKPRLFWQFRGRQRQHSSHWRPPIRYNGAPGPRCSLCICRNGKRVGDRLNQ